MKAKKIIIDWLIVMLLAISVVAIGVTASKRVVDPVCASITIQVKDSAKRKYVNEGELRQMLHQAGLWQVGKPMSDISCQQIEQHLLTHPMLRQADCYKLAKGELHINVRQRQPLMLIAGDEHYYLDTERKVMPIRASVNTPVVMVKGRIGKQQAMGEMFDFVEWLVDNPFWNDKIHTIRVINPKMVELVDDTHQYTIILGSLDGAQKRLNALEKLYKKGFEHIGYPQYKQIDLQYAGQIVGRK